MPNIIIPPRAMAEVLNQVVSERMPDWNEDIMQQIELEQQLDIVYTDGIYVEDSRQVENLLQPYLGDFAPKGTFTIGSHENKIEIAQIDLLIKAVDQAKFFDTRYPSYSQAGQDPLSQDFVTDFLNEFIMNQLYRETNQLSVNGVRIDRTVEGESSPFLTTFTGYDKLFADEILAGNLNTIVTGAITSSNIVERVQFALSQIPEKLNGLKIKIRMSRTMARWYSQNYKATHQYAVPVITTPTGTFAVVDDYDAMIVPILAMSGKNYFIIDIEENGKTNMIVLYPKTRSAFPELRFEGDKRNVAVMGEMFRRYGLRRYERTYVTRVA
jgi:hypothetical protein